MIEDEVSIDLKNRVDNYNKVLRKYPKLMFDKGWMYGVWYCDRKKQDSYGAYPGTFLKRVRTLFGDLKPFVHLFSGTVIPENGEITVDGDSGLNPMYCCEVEDLPFESNSISCILADPPYSKEQAKHYQCKYPSMRKVFTECSRVLKINSYLVLLHSHLLKVPKAARLKMRGLIGILSGTNAISRILVVYSKEKKENRLVEEYKE